MNINLKYSTSFLFCLFLSCGETLKSKGEIESKDFTTEAFSKIEVSGKFKVFYIPAAQDIVTVESYKNVVNNLSVTVADGTLFIKEKKPTEGVDLYNINIYAHQPIHEISVSDSVEFNTSGIIKSPEIRLILKNNAKFIGAMDVPIARLEMSQTSRANFTGKSQQVYLKIVDTAHVIAPYWRINTIRLDSRNGNYAEINVQDTIKGEVNHTAKLVYYNKPVEAFKAGKTTQIRKMKLN